MKRPATIDGSPLIAVTTVRMRRVPQPLTSFRSTAVATAIGTPIIAASPTCFEGADDRMGDTDVSQGIRLGRFEAFLRLGEKSPPVDRRVRLQPPHRRR